MNRTSPKGPLCNGIHAGALSSNETRLISSEIDGNVGFACGHLLFVDGGALKAQPFDPERLQLTGEPVAIAPQELEVWEKAWYHSGFSIAESGILVFQSSTDFAPELVWADARFWRKLPSAAANTPRGSGKDHAWWATITPPTRATGTVSSSPGPATSIPT